MSYPRTPEEQAGFRAAVLREAAGELDAHASQLADVSDDPAAFVAKTRVRAATEWRVAAELLRRLAAEAPEPATQAEAPDGEAEKLAKARRMAKAMSAPPVAPPEWNATEEWPMRHKRAGDRRVHATAPFSVNAHQEIWTACGKRVGKGGYPLSHMPVDCRECRDVTAAVPAGQTDEEA